MNVKRYFAIGFAAISMSLAAPLLAQDDEPLPPPVVDEQPDEVATPDDILNYILDGLRTFTNVAYAATFVAVVTQFLKVVFATLLPRIGITLAIDPALLALVVQIIVWVGHTLTLQTGYGQQYQDILALLENILKAFQPFLPQAVLAAAATHVGYNVLHKTRVPGFRMEIKRANPNAGVLAQSEPSFTPAQG